MMDILPFISLENYFLINFQIPDFESLTEKNWLLLSP